MQYTLALHLYTVHYIFYYLKHWSIINSSLKELSEDSKTLKEDFGRVKTHLNVAAKLELQTQEKMYESRLYHLENVLEEMRQREGHFMRLAEETAVLKDQVREQLFSLGCGITYHNRFKKVLFVLWLP